MLDRHSDARPSGDRLCTNMDVFKISTSDHSEAVKVQGYHFLTFSGSR